MLLPAIPTEHPRCTKAQVAARELRSALTELREHAIHTWNVDAMLYEVDVIIDSLAEHAQDLHIVGKDAS